MDAIEQRARELVMAEIPDLAKECFGYQGMTVVNLHVVMRILRAALTPPEGEALSESDKDVALAQAVEFAKYVERQAKGAMVDTAKRFLSLPYAQELAKRLATCPEVP